MADLSRDQPGRPLKPQVSPSPFDHHEETVPEPDQPKDVDEAPQQPHGEPGEADSAHVHDGRRSAHRRHRATIPVSEGREWLVADAPHHIARRVNPLLDGHRSKPRQRPSFSAKFLQGGGGSDRATALRFGRRRVFRWNSRPEDPVEQDDDDARVSLLLCGPRALREPLTGGAHGIEETRPRRVRVRHRSARRRTNRCSARVPRGGRWTGGRHPHRRRPSTRMRLAGTSSLRSPSPTRSSVVSPTRLRYEPGGSTTRPRGRTQQQPGRDDVRG